MRRLAIIFHRRSLTLSVIALLLGLATFARIFDFDGLAHQQGPEFVRKSVVLCIVAFMVCISVLANLLLDVRQGYSSSRCSLASVIILAAFAGPAFLACSLANYCLR